MQPRDRNRVSLSKSALLLSPCVAWAADSAKWYDDRYADTSKRDSGTRVHEAIQSGLLWQSYAISNDEHVLVAHALLYVKDHFMAPDTQFLTEAAVAINWSKQTAELVNAKNRDYPEMPGFQFGTADLVYFNKDGNLVIVDWKTGGTDGAKEQLLSLAYGFWKATKRKVKEVQCVQLTPDAAIPTVYPVTDELLEVHAFNMHCQLQEALSSDNKPVPGIHCTQLYCPHLAHCGAITGIVEETSNGDQSKLLLSPEVLLRRFRMTDKPSCSDEAGYTMSRVTASGRQNKYFTEVMKDYCRNGGKVLAGGYEWKETGSGFRWVKQ